MEIKKIAIEHSYYCSDTNYYSNKETYHYPTWGDFMAEMGDMDKDYNLLFRFDIKKYEESDIYHAELFYMQQRKGKFTISIVDEVTDNDADSINEYLKGYWKYIKKLWEPISENQDADTSGNFEEMEERFCLVLEHATLGSMSRSNYDLETMKSVIDDAQQKHYYGVVKSDLEQLIKDGGTMEDVKDYIKVLE